MHLIVIVSIGRRVGLSDTQGPLLSSPRCDCEKRNKHIINLQRRGRTEQG